MKLKANLLQFWPLGSRGPMFYHQKKTGENIIPQGMISYFFSKRLFCSYMHDVWYHTIFVFIHCTSLIHTITTIHSYLCPWFHTLSNFTSSFLPTAQSLHTMSIFTRTLIHTITTIHSYLCPWFHTWAIWHLVSYSQYSHFIPCPCSYVSDFIPWSPPPAAHPRWPPVISY